jgi:hypothetical protein
MGAAEDIEAIKQLKARYFRTLDTKDWDGLTAVFADEVDLDLSSEGAGVIHDVVRFVASLRDILGEAITVHHGHMPEIELTSPTTATGIWAMEDRLWWPEPHPVRYLHGYGHYHETYEKTDGVWRIKTMELTRLKREMDT